MQRIFLVTLVTDINDNYILCLKQEIEKVLEN
jgi:hypothetical protein